MVLICPLDFKCLCQFWELVHKWQSVWTRSSGHILFLYHIESKQCHWGFAIHSLHSADFQDPALLANYKQNIHYVMSSSANFQLKYKFLPSYYNISASNKEHI